MIAPRVLPCCSPHCRFSPCNVAEAGGWCLDRRSRNFLQPDLSTRGSADFAQQTPADRVAAIDVGAHRAAGCAIHPAFCAGHRCSDIERNQCRGPASRGAPLPRVCPAAPQLRRLWRAVLDARMELPAGSAGLARDHSLLLVSLNTRPWHRYLLFGTRRRGQGQRRLAALPPAAGRAPPCAAAGAARATALRHPRKHQLICRPQHARDLQEERLAGVFGRRAGGSGGE